PFRPFAPSTTPTVEVFEVSRILKRVVFWIGLSAPIKFSERRTPVSPLVPKLLGQKEQKKALFRPSPHPEPHPNSRSFRSVSDFKDRWCFGEALVTRSNLVRDARIWFQSYWAKKSKK